MRRSRAAATPQEAALRAKGMSDGNVIEALAIAAEYARRNLKLAPFTEQLACAAALVRGAVAEMETGEGKTLAAFLAATVFGLAGRAVHIVTANDYLADRDAQDLRGAYAALGLSVGMVIGGDLVHEAASSLWRGHRLYFQQGSRV